MSIAVCEDITVIAQRDVPVRQIDNADIVSIFTRKQLFWPNGYKTVVFTKPLDSIEHKLFTINVLNLTPYRYKTILDGVVYSGNNSTIIEVASDNEMVLKLSSTPYSIGYINNLVMVHYNNGVVKIKYE
jgi:hypothetical protein